MNALIEPYPDEQEAVFSREDVLNAVPVLDSDKTSMISSHRSKMMLAVKLYDGIEFGDIEIKSKRVTGSWVTQVWKSLFSRIADILGVEEGCYSCFAPRNNTIFVTTCRTAMSLVVICRSLHEGSVTRAHYFNQRVRSIIHYFGVIIFGPEVGGRTGNECLKPFIQTILKTTLLTPRALEMIGWCNTKGPMVTTLKSYFRSTVNILDKIVTILVTVNFGRSAYERFSVWFTASSITARASTSCRVGVGQLCKASVFRAPNFDFISTFGEHSIGIDIFVPMDRNTLVDKLFSPNMQGDISHASIYLTRS